MKNLYFQRTFGRSNLIVDILVGILIAVASYPNLLLSVFIRNNFGERRFNIVSAITVFVILSLPIVIYFIESRIPEELIWPLSFLGLFNLTFLYFAWKRNRETPYHLTQYDFTKFSLYSGESTVNWSRFPFLKSWAEEPTKREILAEPLLFFVPGLIMCFTPVTIFVGVVLVISSLPYGGSHWAAYRVSREVILEKNDERICNEDMARIFI